MQKVTITKTSINFSFWDESAEKWINRSIDEASLPISWYMAYPIQFDEPLSVKEFVNLLKPYASDLALILPHSFAVLEADRIWKEASADSPSSTSMKATDVYLIKIGESTPTEQDGETFNFLHSYPVLMGLEIIDETGDNDILYPLSNIEFSEWKNLPIGVDDYLEYINTETDEVLFEGAVNWTFQEVISAILSQISMTIQLTDSSIEKDPLSPTESGPLLMKDVFDWIDDLDRIFLGK